jgi:hypothetical protein
MIKYDGGSFKDPAGRVFHHDGWVYRTLSSQAIQNLSAARDCGLTRELISQGLLLDVELVRAEEMKLLSNEVGGFVLRQRRIPFVSYSYEWSFEMLRDAALVTLRILERALAHDMVLKDANAFNILFDGRDPRHIDPPSLEPYEKGHVWAGYAQFCRSFLFPLLLAAYRDVDIRAILRATIGELPVHETARLLRSRDYLRPGVVAHVLAQLSLERSFARASQSVKSAIRPVHYPKAALINNVTRLVSLIERLKPSSAATEWSGYEQSHSYSDEDHATKAAFVRAALGSREGQQVVDLGCNTGTFARIARETGGQVVALDIDSPSIDRLYRRASHGEAISPVVANLLNPTPAMGWGLKERLSLLTRLRSDFFLALALIHHLRIAGGVPLALVLDQLLAVAPEGVIEWVDKSDDMVRHMLALRKDVYEDYTQPTFEALVHERCEIVAVQRTHNGRRGLYHVRRTPVARA